MVTPHQPTHHEHAANPFPSSPAPEPAREEETVFGARNPELLIRSEDHLIGFRDGEYRTTHPGEIALLHGVVHDESRGNRGVWVKQLPRGAHEQAPKHRTVEPVPHEPAAPTSPHTPPPTPTPPHTEHREPKHHDKPKRRAPKPASKLTPIRRPDANASPSRTPPPPHHDEHREPPMPDPMARTPRATERGF